MNPVPSTPKKTAKKPSLISRYADAATQVIMKPFAGRVNYDFRSAQEKKDEADPKSPKYKKNLVDRFVDRVLPI